MRQRDFLLACCSVSIGGALLFSVPSFRNWVAGLSALIQSSSETSEVPSLVRASPRGKKLVEMLPKTGFSLYNFAFRKTAEGQEKVFACAPGGMEVELTLTPTLQHKAEALLNLYKPREAAIVMADAITGRVLAYASHVEGGPARDLCVEASAPAASLFKLVTTAALLKEGVDPFARQCYSGGSHRIDEKHLLPSLGGTCVTLLSALAKSANAVFARLAVQWLTPEKLMDMARSFGFHSPLPFDVPVSPSRLVLPHQLSLPQEKLSFARIAAGFGSTTVISPLDALTMSRLILHATISARKSMPPLSIVHTVHTSDHKILYREGESLIESTLAMQAHQDMSAHTLYEMQDTVALLSTVRPAREHGRQLDANIASLLKKAMEGTIREGTSYKTFHDKRGRPLLQGVSIAGKTGSLTDPRTGLHRTWFSGFLSSSSVTPVVIATMVGNGPKLRTTANILAREILRTYLQAQQTHEDVAPNSQLSRKKQKLSGQSNTS